MRWFDVVRVKSTSSWFITSSRFTPSVSSCHSDVFANVSVSGSRPMTFASRMNTLRMSGIPRRLRFVRSCASRRFKNTSSSVVTSPTSPFSNSSFMIRILRSSFSELSSLKMQLRSSSKSSLMRSAMFAMRSFLSTIISRFSSILSSHGLIRLGSTSSSGIS